MGKNLALNVSFTNLTRLNRCPYLYYWASIKYNRNISMTRIRMNCVERGIILLFCRCGKIIVCSDRPGVWTVRSLICSYWSPEFECRCQFWWVMSGVLVVFFSVFSHSPNIIPSTLSTVSFPPLHVISYEARPQSKFLWVRLKKQSQI